MFISIAQYKGGVGKTMTAMHFAAFFHHLAPTLLVDSDPNRDAIKWQRRGEGKLPFLVVPESQGPKFAKTHKHVIVDTRARPHPEDVQELIDACDLLVLPVSPDAQAVEQLLDMIATLRSLRVPPERYRVLITMVPPLPERDGELLRAQFVEDGLPLFHHGIRYLKVYKKAAMAGVLVNVVKDPRAQEAWNDYKRVCEEVAL